MDTGIIIINENMIKNNIDRFDNDFMFQLTEEEVRYITRCKNFTSMQTKGKKGGRVYLPYAFTEQGIYMLMILGKKFQLFFYYRIMKYIRR